MLKIYVNLIYHYKIISDISGLMLKIYVNFIYLTKTNIHDISGFDVKNLRELNLSGTKISDISGFDVKN